MAKEHSYKTFEEDLKAGNIGNLLLIYGKEQYLVKWAAGAILKKYVNDDYMAFDYSEIEPENAAASHIIESCETLSLFSEKRVVCLSGFTPVAGGKLKNFPEAEEKSLIEYIKKIPDTCILVITSEKADKRLKIYKEIASAGIVYEFPPLDAATLKAFIEKRFKQLGKKIKPNVVSELITGSGYLLSETEYTLYNIVNEVKKIAAHAEGDEIMASDVLEVISGDVETFIFLLIDAIGRNKKTEAFKLLNNIMRSGTSWILIQSLLTSQFEIMLDIKELKEEGKANAQIPGLLGIHEFRVKKAAAAAELYSKKRLKDVLKKVYQIEKNVKSGLMSSDLAFEVLISEI